MRNEVQQKTNERALSSTFGGLAQLYFPDRTKELASRAFSRWLNDNAALIMRMQMAGWRRRMKTFTPKQVELIYNEFGRP